MLKIICMAHQYNLSKIFNYIIERVHVYVWRVREATSIICINCNGAQWRRRRRSISRCCAIAAGMSWNPENLFVASVFYFDLGFLSHVMSCAYHWMCCSVWLRRTRCGRTASCSSSRARRTRTCACCRTSCSRTPCSISTSVRCL